MKLLVEKYHYEPFSSSIWRLRIPSLGIVVQCIEPQGKDFGNIAKGSSITGSLVLEMAKVKVIADELPTFTKLADNINLSDGSKVRCIGKVRGINLDDNEFKLDSVIEVNVQAETLPDLGEGDTVDVIGILRFEPTSGC